MNESMSLAISTLLDPERLSGALGEARAASRVRIKPGVSVSASLVNTDGVSAGWARIRRMGFMKVSGRRRAASAFPPGSAPCRSACASTGVASNPTPRS